MKHRWVSANYYRKSPPDLCFNKQTKEFEKHSDKAWKYRSTTPWKSRVKYLQNLSTWVKPQKLGNIKYSTLLLYWSNTFSLGPEYANLYSSLSPH